MADEEELECPHGEDKLPTTNDASGTNGVIGTSAVVVANGKQ